MFDYKQRETTDEYREGWDRIWGKCQHKFDYELKDNNDVVYKHCIYCGIEQRIIYVARCS